MASTPILGWLSARNIPSDRMHRHPPKGRFRGVEILVPGSSWPRPPYRCPAVLPRRSERSENVVSRTARTGSGRAARDCISWSGSRRGRGSWALHIAPRPAVRLRACANGSWSAGGSALPVVMSQGFPEEPAHDDDHVREGDPEVDHPPLPLGAPHQFLVGVLSGVRPLHHPTVRSPKH